MLSLDDLALEPSAAGFSRVIGPDWTFADRVFGGYTAALALTAAHEVATHPHAVSARFGFLEAAVPGPVTLEVNALRAGRSLWAGRVLATQTGRAVLTCEVWFADRPAAESDEPGVVLGPGPDDCPSMGWLPAMWPCMGFLEERAIDYPAGPTECGGGSQLAVWARPAKDIGPDPFQGQVLDLMLADAHLMDAALRSTGLGESLGFSLDIGITWETPRRSPGWLLLRAEAESGTDGFVTCRGTVCAPDGSLRATALTQGRLFS
jgi:acyl-CoA thioesterase